MSPNASRSAIGIESCGKMRKGNGRGEKRSAEKSKIGIKHRWEKEEIKKKNERGNPGCELLCKGMRGKKKTTPWEEKGVLRSEHRKHSVGGRKAERKLARKKPSRREEGEEEALSVVPPGAQKGGRLKRPPSFI